MLIFVLLVLCCGETVMSSSCFWNNYHHFSKHFASKAPYNVLRGDLRDNIIKIKGCEPISVWGLYRHGKKYPGRKFANKMKAVLKVKDHIVTNYKIGKSPMCAQDVENLHNFRIDDNFLNKHLELTQEGFMEMYELGKRVRYTFHSLLRNLDFEKYTIRPAYADRMMDSAKAFVEGFKAPNLTIESPNPDFDVMAPYATCGKFFKDGKDPATFVEVFKYKNTLEFLQTKTKVQKRVGDNYTLTNDDIEALYDLCRYIWSGITNTPSPWCALFDEEDIQVLEYVSDMRQYYRNSYPSPISKPLGQIPMADLFEHFQQAKDGKGNKFTAYISHGSVLDMVLTALDVFKGENRLTRYRNPHRKWSTSKTTSFGANLIVVLNRCEGNEPNNYNVIFYLNEKPLTSICKESVCRWQDFEEKLKPFVNTTIDFCEFKTDPFGNF